jgi:hypothetical protein
VIIGVARAAVLSAVAAAVLADRDVPHREIQDFQGVTNYFHFKKLVSFLSDFFRKKEEKKKCLEFVLLREKARSKEVAFAGAAKREKVEALEPISSNVHGVYLRRIFKGFASYYLPVK